MSSGAGIDGPGASTACWRIRVRAWTLRCSHSTTKGMRSLEILGLTGRVIATATAPLTLTR
jgi:hypothetical protein